MTQALNRIRIGLNLSSMTNEQLLQLVVAITALAPQSALISIASIATSVAAVTSKGATFKSNSDTVKADEEKLRNDKTALGTSRGALEGEVATLAALVGSNAKNAADVASMAFQVAPAPVVVKSPPATPDVIDVVIPKKGRGRAKASVHETGGEKGRYAAEWSPDPFGPTTWVALPGTGKSRNLTGASGTKIWVRFARVRGQLQSDWSTPVLVTFP